MENLKFRNFWNGEDATKSLLRDIFNPLTTDGRRVTVTSVYPKKSLITGLKSRYIQKFSGLETRNERRMFDSYQIVPADQEADINIWYSAENARPPVEGYDLSISCDPSDGLLKNIFFPYWATQGGASIEEVSQYQKVLCNSRETVEIRENSICALVGNPHPTRLHVLKVLANSFKVDCYGPVFGRVIPDKSKLLQNYRFNLCFENDLYPGYLSEKPFESWMSGCIPIWWGIDRGDYLNPEGILDFTSMTISDLIQRIDELENNPQKVAKILRAPILLRPFDLRLLQKEIIESLASVL